eukprot:4824566-Amphidinium_carterae.1
MRTQDCRPLKTKKHKKRPTGFTADTEEASLSGVPPVGEAAGGLFPLESTVQSGNWLTTAGESGNRLSAPVESGGTGSTEAAPSGLTGGAGRVLLSISGKDRTNPTESFARMPLLPRKLLMLHMAYERHALVVKLEDNDLAEFPRPVHHRIPNFKGSSEA